MERQETWKMASDIAMMLILSAAAALAVVITARAPDMPGHYTDPTWIVAAMAAVLMVQGFYLIIWICRMFRAFERLLLILTGVAPEEARPVFQGTLRRMRRLMEEVTHDEKRRKDI
jgi:hypothetical protein